MKSSAEKHFRCTVCQRGFTRIDHLKRHQLRRMCLVLMHAAAFSVGFSLPGRWTNPITTRLRIEALLVCFLQ